MNRPMESKAPKADSYKTPLSQYVPGDFDGKNKAGWEPVTDCVLVLPDTPQRKVGSLIIPDAVADRHALAAESGILVATGPDAFVWNSDRTRRLEGTEKPQPGCRVVFNRYSGINLAGDDGQGYYILVDHSVKATRPL